MSEKTPDQLKLEAVIMKLAKHYNELVKVVEKSSTIEPEHLGKAFAFLSNIQNDSHNKAVLSISTAKAANGGFSLEMDITPSPAPSPSLRKPAGERIVGERKGPKPPPDDDDGIGFIDE